MAVVTVTFNLLFKSLHLFVFFLSLLEFEQGWYTVGYSVSKIENTLVYCSSEALCVIRIVWSPSDYVDRLAGFRMLLVNATKTQTFAMPQAS